jgi:CBS domain-containing protein
VVDVVERNVPLCSPVERIEEVRARVAGLGESFCLVLGHDDVLLGLLGRRILHGTEWGTAAELMAPGPSTVRPHLPLELLVDRLRRTAIRVVPVTTPRGRLLGVAVRETAERVLGERTQAGRRASARAGSG